MKIAGAEAAATLSRVVVVNMEKKINHATVPPAGDKAQVAPRGKQQEAAPKIGEQEISRAIEKANKAIRGPKTGFRFHVHEGTQEIMVRVINEETGEVIREIPPEKILDMIAKMWELAGLFVDEKR